VAAAPWVHPLRKFWCLAMQYTASSMQAARVINDKININIDINVSINGNIDIDININVINIINININGDIKVNVNNNINISVDTNANVNVDMYVNTKVNVNVNATRAAAHGALLHVVGSIGLFAARALAFDRHKNAIAHKQTSVRACKVGGASRFLHVA
jgi:hypothetical protein